MRTHREIGAVVLLTLSLSLCLSACGGDDKGTDTGIGGAPGAGGGVATGGSLQAGAGGAGPQCSDIGGPCEAGGDCCDPVAICNTTDQAAERRGCQKRCTTAAECTTGCCLLFQSQSFGICTDAKWCACGAEGSRCGGQEPACCAGQTCVGGDPEGTFFECRPRCNTPTECATQCCVEIVAGQISACLDAATYCPR